MTHAAMVATGIEESSQSRFMIICLSRGASSLKDTLERYIQLNSDHIDRKIDRQDEGRWYNRVKVFCD